MKAQNIIPSLPQIPMRQEQGCKYSIFIKQLRVHGLFYLGFCLFLFLKGPEKNFIS